ncbi:hypothetical protein C4572_01395 [Candidatus Parcubacteria bacterium]|nr:MAG: hypothetical protein C4572_01395 [Candidatus Parcubacteria bacterium]
MLLKKIEISGFKSFAKTTMLEFPCAVSAIVGPNGSGKSNVAEALKWVLGEQSMKSLRGKRGEDLIFNGSQSAPKMGRASVTLVFDNKDKVLPIDYDEARISRVVHRTGENEYLINDSPARLKDIIELLSRMGLGVSSHHIISQGEADRLLNASVKERKDMIEEALGLKIYRVKKADAEKRLEKTTENIRQVEELRREIHHQLKFLKREVDKIEEIEKLKTELKTIYSRYFPKENGFLIGEKGQIEAQKEELEKEIARLREEKAAFLANSPGEEEKKGIKNKEAELSFRESELSKVRFNRNAMERELGKLEGIIEYRKSLGGEESKDKKEEKPPIPFKEVFSVIDSLGKTAKAGMMETDVGQTRKIFAEIIRLSEDFISKFSGEKPVKNLSGQKDIRELETKHLQIRSLIDQLEEKEKQLLGEAALIKSSIEESRKKILELERENYQAEARSKELFAIHSRIVSEGEKIKIRSDELAREELEAAALLGREFVDGLPKDASGNDQFDYQEREKFLRQAERLKIKLEDCGIVSDETVKEYNSAMERDGGYQKELNDLAEAEKSLREVMEQLAERIENDFVSGVEKINSEFVKFFVSIFGGGKAELLIAKIKAKKEDDDDGLADVSEVSEEVEEPTGVEIKVSHPKKRISSLEMLSGGERSLVAISLLFAISQVNPPPFLILDETDAALDESNSQKYALMLKSLGERTQLIVITHNRETMRQADALFGVTMGSDGISRLLSIKFDDARQYAADK